MLRPAIIAAAILSAAPASAFFAENGLLVEREGSDTFNVPYRGLSGASDFWCAAGDYVVLGLGLPPATRIYRVSSPPRRSGQGIRFSLDPSGATRPGLIMLSREKGLTAAFARQFCDVNRRRASP